MVETWFPLQSIGLLLLLLLSSAKNNDFDSDSVHCASSSRLKLSRRGKKSICHCVQMEVKSKCISFLLFSLISVFCVFQSFASAFFLIRSPSDSLAFIKSPDQYSVWITCNMLLHHSIYKSAKNCSCSSILLCLNLRRKLSENDLDCFIAWLKSCCSSLFESLLSEDIYWHLSRKL